MATVFCRVTADISPDFIDHFPIHFDFIGILQRICEEAGVSVTVSDKLLNLQGQWGTIGRVHSMLLSALKVYGQSAAIRKETEGQIGQRSGSFTALVEAAEAISRGVELQEQVQHEMMRMKTYQSAPHVAAPQFLSQEIPFARTPLSESKSNLTRQEVDILPPAEIGLKYNQPTTDGMKTDVLSKGHNSKTNQMHFESKKGTENAKSTQELVMDDGTEVSVFDFEPAHQDPEYRNEADEDSTINELNIQTKKDNIKSGKHGKAVKKKNSINTLSTEKLSQKAASLIPLKKQSRKIKEGSSAVSVYHKTVKKKYSTISKRLKGIRPTDSAQKGSQVKTETAKTRRRGRPRRVFEHGVEAFQCDQCDFKAKTRNALGDHRHRIHLAKPTKCDLCLKIFPNVRYMKRHRASHVKAPHYCDICGKMYKVAKALRDHKKRHETNYKRLEFNCVQCSKSFSTQYILQCHIKSEHMGIKKSFLCPTCGKSFTTKHTLQQHLNVHIGARPYACEVCGKSFSYESALRDHRYVHAGTKNFICSEPSCLKAFRQRSALKMHEKIHKEQKDFNCEQCGRGFTQKQALQRHIRAHKGLKPFTCKLCGRTFGDASIIRRHMILVHKIHKDPSCWREDIISNVKADKDFRVTTPAELLTDDNHMELTDCDRAELKLDDRHMMHVPVLYPNETDVVNSLKNRVDSNPVKTNSPVPEITTLQPPTGDIQADDQSLDYPVNLLLPLSDALPSTSALESTPATSDPYSLSVPLVSHPEYTVSQTVTPGQYTYTITNLDPSLYQSSSRPPQLIPTADDPGNYMRVITVEERNNGDDTVPHSSHEQEKPVAKIAGEPTMNVEKSLDVPAMTVNLQTLKTIEALANAGALVQTPQDVAAGRPTEILVTRPVDAAANSVTEEIAKRLYESSVAENQPLSSLYAYYTNLASQYMNIAQHWPQQNQDSSNSQQ